MSDLLDKMANTIVGYIATESPRYSVGIKNGELDRCDFGRFKPREMAKVALEVVLDELNSDAMVKVTTEQYAYLIDSRDNSPRSPEISAAIMVAAVYDVLDGTDDGERNDVHS